MAPEEEVCGKTVDDFPELPKDLPPEQIQQINDVCRSDLQFIKARKIYFFLSFLSYSSIWSICRIF